MYYSFVTDFFFILSVEKKLIQISYLGFYLMWIIFKGEDYSD